MNRNMGTIDRVIRMVAAALFVYIYFGGILQGTWGLVLLVFGGIFAITALIGFCPLYMPFGLKTCK